MKQLTDDEPVYNSLKPKYCRVTLTDDELIEAAWRAWAKYHEAKSGEVFTLAWFIKAVACRPVEGFILVDSAREYFDGFRACYELLNKGGK